LKCGFERAEGLLCPGQVSRLQSLSDGGEVLLALGKFERIPAGKRTALSQRDNAVVGGLGVGQAPGSKVPVQAATSPYSEFENTAAVAVEWNRSKRLLST
jgi:hypothetical protein